MILVTHTADLLRQDCPMAIVVVHLAMPFAQIYNMAETRSERTDRGISYPVEHCRMEFFFPLSRSLTKRINLPQHARENV